MEFTKIAHAPLTFIGWGALQQLRIELARYISKRVLLITDPNLVKIGLTEVIADILVDSGCYFHTYIDVIPEPQLETAEKLLLYARRGNYDLIIGFGGGSVLDLAKLTAVMIAHPGSVGDYLNLSATREIQHRGIPKVLIPTTSGTGSEATNIAVLSLGTTKDVISHDHLQADLAIVDAHLTVSLPPRITAATGMDALTHAIEAYISINANPVSNALAIQAIHLIGRSLCVAVQEGTNKQARIDLSYGSYIAGMAFFNAGVAAVHALAYPLGGQYHIPHGESNAVLLPYVMSYIRNSCSDKLIDISNALDDNGKGTRVEAGKCVNKLFSLVGDLGLPRTLKELNIPQTALEGLAVDGAQQKRLLARSPMPLSKDDILRIYQTAFSGVMELAK